MTKGEAGAIIAQTCQPDDCDFDYLKGRVIKTDISGDKIDLWLYKRDNAHVDIERIIIDLNNGIAITPKASFPRPTNQNEYNAFLLRKLAIFMKNLI